MDLSTQWRRDDRYALLLAGMMWVLIVLMIVPEGFDYEGLHTIGPPSSGGPVSRLLWIGLLVLSLVVVFSRVHLVVLLSRFVNPFLWMFMLLAIASIAWSIDAELSTRRLVRMVTIALTCVAFVSIAWHPRRFQNVLRPILTIMIVGSLIFGVVFPDLAIHSETAPELLGAWHGLANHKNGLGALSCVGLIFWLHGGLTGETKLLPTAAGCVAALTSLALSRSSTSMLAAVFAFLFLMLMLRRPRLQPYQPLLVALLVALLLVYALALLNLIPGMSVLLAPITALTAKDATLTGRTEIWAILADHIREHPLLGTGYAAYWHPDPLPGSDSYDFILRMGGFYPGSAHNGFMEVTNDLGWVGLACLIAYIITFARQALVLLPLERRQCTLYLALFFEQVISNQSESHWFTVLSVDFVIMTLATTALARSLLEQRLRTIFGDPFGVRPRATLPGGV